jgi:hypothetical protein
LVQQLGITMIANLAVFLYTADEHEVGPSGIEPSGLFNRQQRRSQSRTGFEEIGARAAILASRFLQPDFQPGGPVLGDKNPWWCA